MKNKFFFLILISYAILQFFTWSVGHNWGGDFASYIMQSIAISNGDIEGFFFKNSTTFLPKNVGITIDLSLTFNICLDLIGLITFIVGITIFKTCEISLIYQSDNQWQKLINSLESSGNL